MSRFSFEKSALRNHFSGKLFVSDSPISNLYKKIYSTDASVYQVAPLGVALIEKEKDIRRLIQYAALSKTPLIPRAAGTSLGGQVVGNGIIVEIGGQMNKILALNKREKWAWVEPGIIRDDLNHYLAKSNLFFGPETSTSNRAMIGGMIGNNSVGLRSIKYGNTRESLLETYLYLSDGTDIHTHPLSTEEFYKKCELKTFEGKIYRELHRMLNNPEIQALIKNNFPKKSVSRRNTGYALDELIEMQPFNPDGKPFNLSALIAGSEGTLGIVHNAKLQLIDRPFRKSASVCIHTNDIIEAMKANLLVLKHHPFASELVDKLILDFTIGHKKYEKYRDFIDGDPGAILIAEFRCKTTTDLNNHIEGLIQDLKAANLGYSYPILYGEQADKAWEIRKAGLGLIRNMNSEEQAVNLIEDCAVAPEDLPEYIYDIQFLLRRYKLQAAFYAHAGAGQLHIEPFINLKTKEGKAIFRSLLRDTVEIVKKYNGSLSGEHGDGRLRGEFIPKLMGNEVYELFREVKNLFDPHGLLNPGKIVDTPPMDEDFRFESIDESKLQPIFDYGERENPYKLAEKCSGSGDCKKSILSGGTMCPSFMATLEEKDSTRARANIVRQILVENAENGFLNPDFNEIMQNCLSCKACQVECPSGVDIAMIKAEGLQKQYDTNGIKLKTKIIGHLPYLQNSLRKLSPIINFVSQVPPFSILTKSFLGFSQKTHLPKIHFSSLADWYKSYAKKIDQEDFEHGTVLVYNDEFTNNLEVNVGIKAIKLLNELGFGVELTNGLISGRTFLSVGMVRKAKAVAKQNLEKLKLPAERKEKIIFLEPSAHSSFLDEYPKLFQGKEKEMAEKLKKSAQLIDEFLVENFKNGKIKSNQFSNENKDIYVHGHCHQRAVVGLGPTRIALEIPANFKTHLIPSGCCGMAGSFGYQEETYEISQKIGNLSLFPYINQLKLESEEELILAVNGTSCRHQIKEGTEMGSKHSVEILYEFLKEKKLDEVSI